MIRLCASTINDTLLLCLIDYSMTDATEMLYLIHEVRFIACESVYKDVCWF